MYRHLWAGHAVAAAAATAAPSCEFPIRREPCGLWACLIHACMWVMCDMHEWWCLTCVSWGSNVYVNLHFWRSCMCSFSYLDTCVSFLQTFFALHIAARGNHISGFVLKSSVFLFFWKQFAFEFNLPKIEKVVLEGVLPYRFGVLACFQLLNSAPTAWQNAFVDHLRSRAR
jgi:hypothetical protein